MTIATLTTKYAPTGEQIATLNAARTVCNEAFGGYAENADDGRISAYAQVAENAIFDLLNVLHSHGGFRLTEAQIHNRADS